MKNNPALILFYILTLWLCSAVFIARFVFFYDWSSQESIMGCLIALAVLIVQSIVFVLYGKKSNKNKQTINKILRFDIFLNLVLLLCIALSLLASYFRIPILTHILPKVSLEWAYFEVIKIAITLVARFLQRNHRGTRGRFA